MVTGKRIVVFMNIDETEDYFNDDGTVDTSAVAEFIDYKFADADATVYADWDDVQSDIRAGRKPWIDDEVHEVVIQEIP